MLIVIALTSFTPIFSEPACVGPWGRGGAAGLFCCGAAERGSQVPRENTTSLKNSRKLRASPQNKRLVTGRRLQVLVFPTTTQTDTCGCTAASAARGHFINSEWFFTHETFLSWAELGRKADRRLVSGGVGAAVS